MDGAIYSTSCVLHGDLKGLAKTTRGTSILGEADALNAPLIGQFALDCHRRGLANNKHSVLDYLLPDPPPRRRVSDNAPLLIADELESIFRSGDSAMWANFAPGAYRYGLRTFEHWLGVEGPLAPLGKDYGLNCWEMICYAAHRVGVLDKSQMRELLTPPRTPEGILRKPTEKPPRPGAEPIVWAHDNINDWWQRRIGKWLIPGDRAVYTGCPGTARPQRGDLLMWNNDAAHVTMATGHTGADGSPEVYSFWPPPKHEMVLDFPSFSFSRVTDAVQVTTVDTLSEAAVRVRAASPPFEIIFGRGPW
ncbi:hypothetical protein [Nocardia testacea]|uniref:hypothetical protein n=1 Tax=Nocardia testacea TaxID=248551 RepID=UPI003A8A279E